MYFSGEGVYNQLNLETLKGPDGSYVLDKNVIVPVSCTRDIVPSVPSKRFFAKQTAAKAPELSAFLLGNPQYYEKATVSESAGTAEDANWDQLPGAEEEVNQIGKLLASAKWNTKQYVRKTATEDEVKQMASPRVCHIATHGFFLEEEEGEGDGENTGLRSETKMAENAMLRSGILLSSGGDIYNQKGNLNTKNGILTAYEAMSLNLDNTELVVLSACETGLGKVHAGEGVYGLQRALLVAGAHNVIMSLFKVDDKASQELMLEFYKDWLKTGNKRQALIDAKREIKKKWPQPIYWGSFVMIGK